VRSGRSPEPPQLPVYVLTGPTGAGKTDWAIHLAERAPVEIVSVDSALVYRGLDIGTAKPSRELRARVPHHLIDICDPVESYSAGRFVTDVLASIQAIHSRRRIPLLVGVSHRRRADLEASAEHREPARGLAASPMGAGAGGPFRTARPT